MATRVTPITSAVNRTPTNARRNARTQKINVTPTQSANNVGSTAAATNAVRSSNAVQSSNAATNVVRRSTAATNAVRRSTAATNAVQRSTAATNAVRRSTAATNAVRSSTAATNSAQRSTEVTVTKSSQVTSPIFASKNISPTAPKLTTKNPKQFSQTEPVLSVSKETIPFMSQTKQILPDTRTVAPIGDSVTSIKGAASSTPKIFKPGFIDRNTNGVAAKSTSLSVDNLKIILPVVAGSIILLVIFFVIIVVAVRRRRKKRLYLESTDESFATAYPGYNNGANADVHSGVNPFYRAEHQPSRPPPHMIQRRPSITTLESQQTPHFFFNTHGGGPSNTLDNVSEYTYYDGPPLPPKLRR